MMFLLLLSLTSFVASTPVEQVRGIDNYFPTYFVRAAGNHGHNHVTPTDKFVGFSAGLTSMVNTNDTDLIVYDRVFLNMGNGYNSNTGVFTCPNAGTYAFLVHGVSTATSQLNLDLYRNNNYTVSVFAHARNGYASGHQSIVLQLDEQDMVFVQGRGVNSLYGANHEVYSTFSGYLVVPAALPPSNPGLIG
ncbi:complement C1q tumor necrosis factor-related protein 1-like isoform X2 [Ostrea edulis]|uniref:complement C1q tumor necrosis factor-related protein 1-like isoform X2 n=1 Tax=Ostrea edulis TaxID=37623 RepID=UPI00209579EB|nr:complement C1q tumor necrosis factor-related protein 1-like isoform X2 [Ostrea edulis]XP_056010368.1 complement C1q tumor necrosis factor-related protein 1-like isoform X2 [Ostrea edulis]